MRMYDLRFVLVRISMELSTCHVLVGTLSVQVCKSFIIGKFERVQEYGKNEVFFDPYVPMGHPLWGPIGPHGKVVRCEFSGLVCLRKRLNTM